MSYQIAKVLIFLGIFLIFVGIIFLCSSKVSFLGHLPGDIYIKKKNFIFYAPIGTSILISIILSIVFYIIFRLFR